MNYGHPQWGANRRTPNEKRRANSADAARVVITDARFLSATLPPLLQRRSLEKFSDGSTLVSPESSMDKFSEPRARLTGIAYGSGCGVQEHSAVPPVCLPAFIHLIVTLSPSSVKRGAQAGRVNCKPGAATMPIDHVSTRRLDVRPPIRHRHSRRPLLHPTLAPTTRNPADLLASHPR